MNPMSLPLPAASPNLPQLHAALGLKEDPGAELGVGRRVRLLTQDGFELDAHWREPAGPARAVALMAPATGVPQRFYAPFAQWLCQRGYAVLTLDYRGMGASAQAPQASMRDWMLRDLPAALDAVLARARQSGRRLPVVWLGHSLGGHALPLQARLHEVDAALAVGAQLPAFRRWSAGHRRFGAWFFFRAWLPLWVGLTGRLPGWTFGGGPPLPGPAAMDWSHWGSLPDYYRSDPSMAEHLHASRWQGVAQLWCISDDWIFGPEPAVRALQQAFDGAPGQAELLHLHPQDVGARHLGHFGVFRRQHGERVWPLWLQQLEDAVPALRQSRPAPLPDAPSLQPSARCRPGEPADAAGNEEH
jgi:predicted alpha/beta hydrolase